MQPTVVCSQKCAPFGENCSVAGGGQTLLYVYLKSPFSSPRFPSPFRNSLLMPYQRRASPPATANDFNAP